MAGTGRVDGRGESGGVRLAGTIGLRRAVSSERSGGVRAKKARISGGAREGATTATVLAYLNGLVGCYARKAHGSQYSAGWPDIVGCYVGHFFGIEMKRPGQVQSKIQAAEFKKWNAAGARTCVAYSKEDVIGFMNTYHVE